MAIPYMVFFDRVKQATDISSQIDLATALQINRSAITQAKKRDAVPQKWILALARKYALSPDWLEFGTGEPRGAVSGALSSGASSAGAPFREIGAGASFKEAGAGVSTSGKSALGGAVSGASDVSCRMSDQSPVRRVEPFSAIVEGADEPVMVPKAAAKLCAGGGSFEVDAAPVSSYPFPRWWLAKKGSPSDMVFMEVVGDSMEPSIFDGDTVLVDQSRTRLDNHSIFAVGVEDAIYLKRIESRPGGIVLLSENKDYAPIELCGDELDGVRIIGVVVWMCRDCF